MFESLSILKALEEQRMEIIRIERQLCEPLLVDVSYIKTIYGSVEERSELTKSEQRQLFILLVLLFYSPKKLVVGRKIKKRVMAELCKVTGCTQSLLSHNSRNLTFFYQHYQYFREATDAALISVTNALANVGIPMRRIEDYLCKFREG